MPAPSEHTRLSQEARLGEHARTDRSQLEQQHVRHRGAFAYVEAELADGERVKLMRLRYTGAVGRWGFALYLASSDRYEDTPLPTGSPTGTPADALDRACRLHLAAPEWNAATSAMSMGRHELTRAKTINTLRELDCESAPLTFENVARHAGVSRSWLYTQPDIRAEIERLRSLDHRALPPTTPARQRGTEASLARRLEIALARNRDLTDDNQRLRRQLAQALGQLRAAGLPTKDEIAAVPRHSSITIGPC